MKWLSIKRPMTIEEVLEVETLLGVHLPEDYKRQIGSINGGALKNAYVSVPGIGDVPYSRNVSLHRGSPANIFDTASALNNGEIGLFPFAGVGNGDYFCFDLKKNKVVLYMHEQGATVDVCNTFTQLLGSLEV